MDNKIIDIVSENKKYFLPQIFTLVILISLSLMPIFSPGTLMLLYAPFFFYLFFRAMNRARVINLTNKQTNIIVILFPFLIALLYFFGIILVYIITGFNAYSFIHK